MSNRYIGGVVTETTNVAQSPWSGSWTEQAAMQGFGSVLRITNSLRFRASASAYLNRTPSSASNRQTWTWSGWVKRGTLGATQRILDTINTGDGSLFVLSFNSSDQLAVAQQTANVGDFNVTTTQVFRDPSAWYYIDVAVDTTQATAANRIQIYVNGSQLTSFATANYPSQNSSTYVNSTKQHYIGCYADLYARDGYFDGYLAEVNFVDGQALSPTAFGFINQETGVWAPKAYAGTYGLNGFHLSFNNGTSTTTLGYDTSGNGNNWTTNNISLTAGSTYDWMIDSPSKIQGTGYGVGNYCVLNPLDVGTVAGATGYATNANLTGTGDGGLGAALVYGTMAVSSGQWYWEANIQSVGSESSIGMALYTDQSSGTNYVVGTSATSYGYYYTGVKRNNSTNGSYGASYTSGDTIGIAFDASAGSITFYKNGVSQGVAFSSIPAGAYKPAIENRTAGGASIVNVNFGQRPFAYTPPTGYKTLCTQNLPVATIYNGAAYMAATLWTGDGSNSRPISNTVNGVGFAPDFVWVKGRGTTTLNHALYDSVRGSNKNLSSSTTGAETSPSTYGGVGSFDASGFTLVNGTSGTDPVSEVNKASPYTYVGWSWKAGGTAVTNTAGSITSSVSANTTAGFSVVTFTSPSSFTNATIGHGLGATPAMIITKSRTSVGGWVVWHISLGVNGYLSLDSTSASGTNSQAYNGTSSTTFTMGSNSWWQAASQNWVSYCFAAIAGYSAFGSYTGNGSVDGPFVFLGFRPRYVLIKRTDAAALWLTWDTARNQYNLTTLGLFPNTFDVETSGLDGDILSNGFKIRDTENTLNINGGTYIYAAFAENPFSVALAR